MPTGPKSDSSEPGSQGDGSSHAPGERRRRVAKSWTSGKSQAFSLPRQVAKTLIDIDEPKEEKRSRIAKTLLEFDSDKIIKDAETRLTQPAHQSDMPERRVARTILDIDMLDSMGAANPPANETRSSAGKPAAGAAQAPVMPVENTARNTPAAYEKCAQHMEPDTVKTRPADVLKGADRGCQSRFNKVSRQFDTSRKFSRTLVETDIQDIVLNAQHRLNQPSVDAKVVPTERYVAKTMLDYSVLADAVQTFTVRRDAKVQQAEALRKLEPQKPFIPVLQDKAALPCEWSWKESDSKERVRTCEKCQSYVYDFEGLELPQAKDLILRRENLGKFTLYKRTDGKFMTRDCPIQNKRRKKITLAVTFVAVLFALALASAILTPPAPAPAPTKTVVSPLRGPIPTVSYPSGRSSLTMTKGGVGGKNGRDVGFHYEAGKTPIPERNQPPATLTTTTTSTTPDPDEDGSFWQFSGSAQNSPK